jgi:hypothetical protein
LNAAHTPYVSTPNVFTPMLPAADRRILDFPHYIKPVRAGHAPSRYEIARRMHAPY